MIISYDEAVHRLRARPGLSVSARPLFLLPLLRAGCLSTVLGIEAADAGWADEFGVTCHALETVTGVRAAANSGSWLDELVHRLPEPERHAWRGRELGLLPYMNLRPHAQDALARLGARLLLPAPDPVLPVLSDKIAQRAWFRSLGALTPHDTVVGELDHRALRRRFGEVYVVQSPKGSSGRGTHLVTGEEDLRRLAPAERWLVSRYTEGTPINVHALVSGDGTVSVLRPSVQLTHVEGLGAPFGAYSGCDFEAPAALPPLALDRARDTVARVGAELAALGYRGLFGADFVVAGPTPVLLELNCRMQGSSWLLGELELAEQVVPSALRHVLERYGHTTRAEPRLDPVGGCQLVLRHTGPTARVAAAPTGGLHRLKDGGLHRCGAGFGLLECGPDDCVLQQLPAAGTVVHSGAPLARLVTRHALTSADGATLNSQGRLLTDALRAAFAFEPC
ncbi:ATP-grasp domain-containing protein [Kitasatospora sp. LaBMicrA B282]|uniref:ATP-grasp domain-containing protein n=1 Tax=Kitasatospora sp. LaBMicrA B282 TaxID=3420949 RepID=UPI003D0FD3E4